MIYSLWIVPALVLLPACWVLRSREIDRSFPCFCGFIYYSSAVYPLSLAVLLDFGPVTYMSFAIVVELVTYLLMAAAIIEVACDLFWPRRAQPAWIWREMFLLVAVGVSATIALACFVRPVNGGPVSRVALAMEQHAVGPLWIMVVVIFFYANRVDRPFNKVNASISAGFVLLLTVDLATTFIRAVSPWPIALAAAYISQAAFTASVLFWAFRLRAGLPLWVRAGISECQWHMELGREAVRIASRM